jgi:heme-degrading monooxygenase HmoA
MISRHWRGITKPGEAENYLAHLRRHTFPQLERIGGFRGASILKREVTNGVEFLIVTTWESSEAIRRFAGASLNSAVVPPEAQAMMIEYDKEVVHYEVVDGAV